VAVTFNVPDEDKVLEGSGENAVIRVVAYDNKAARVSGYEEKTILTVKAQKRPINLPLILGAGGGGIVIVLLLVVLMRGGGNKKGKGRNPPPQAGPPNYGGGQPPGYGGPPGGGYGGAPGGYGGGGAGYGGGGQGYGAAPPPQPPAAAPAAAAPFTPVPPAMGRRMGEGPTIHMQNASMQNAPAPLT
jgi:hypothetical protein